MRMNPPALGQGAAVVSWLMVIAVVVPAMAGSDHQSVQVQAGLAGDPKTAETYLNANMTFIRKTVPEAIRTCATDLSGETVVSFELIVTVAEGGKIETVTGDPETAFTSCVSRAVAKATLTDPPRAPTDVYLEVSITDR